MLIAVQGNSLPHYYGAVVDRLSDRQHLKVTVRQVAKQIEIVHLPVDKQKRVFGIVARHRGADEQPRGIRVLLPGGAGRSRGPTERPHVREFVAKLRLGSGEGEHERECDSGRE